MATTLDAHPNPVALPLPHLPQRLHHYAFVVKDQEANRHFFEDILGIPLVATWCERSFNADLEREVAYCHTFFGLADGGALAFFQFADDAVYERTRSAVQGRLEHVALKVDRPTYDAIGRRLAAADIPHRQADHGYCRSMYVASPDGLTVEFTVDSDDADILAAQRRVDAHAELARWLKGDHTPNNDHRPAR